MSHVVLARKYRPHSFEEMVGQEHVVQALGNALTSGRLHHAYLFTGTRGIGKTTVSRILAKSLNCTGPDGTGGVTAHPCGVCQACTEIDADRYIDYIELDAASNRSIDEIRDLIERAAYKPSVGRYKVFMIDEAHQLTKDAFNALLKTLEEPPDYLKFVLATTDPEKMLPTVLSRCLQFNLRPMAPETVYLHLERVLQAEGVAAEPGALRLLARAARGSMRDGLSLTDQAIAYGAGTLAEDGVRLMLGTVDRSHAATLVGALARRDGPTVLATVDALRSNGLSAAGTLEEMASLLQQMAVEQAVPGALDDSDPDTTAARQLAAEMPADETQLLYSIAIHGRAELSLVSDHYAALTMVLLRLLAFPPSGSAQPAAAPRTAPLAVAPAVARASAPVRPVAAAVPAVAAPAAGGPASVARAVPPQRTPPAPAATATPLAAARPAAIAAPVPAPTPAAAVRPAAPPVRPVPAPRASASRDAEPPPWVTDDVPDEALADAGDPGPMAGDGVDDDPRSAFSAPSAAATASSPAAAPPASAALQPTALGEAWADRLRPLITAGSITALVRELAVQAQAVDRQPLPAGGERWLVQVERETLRAPALRDKLVAAIAQAGGPIIELEVQAGVVTDSIARRDAAAREAAQREAEALILGDPAVQTLMGQFRTARIVPGSIQPIAPGNGA
jgi:DNA polymerase-3 subunit gamma/tau